MNVLVNRFASLADATLGALYVDGRFACFTLEDQYRAVKVAGETRIPSGTYAVKLQTTGRLHELYAQRYTEHRGMLALQDVPGFTGIMIHVGNREGDTDGCLLVGDMALAGGELGQSVQAYRRVYGQVSNALLAGEQVTIRVEG